MRVVLLIVVGVLAALALTPLPGCLAVRIPLKNPKPAASAAADDHRPAASHTVYFLLGARLTGVPASTKGTWDADTAMAALLAGPAKAQRRQGLTSAIPSGTRLLALALAPGRALVDVPRTFAVGDTAKVRARLAQVVYTLAQFPGIGGVVFYVQGRRMSTLAGTDLMRPQTPSDFPGVVRGQ